ncbi:MAG: nitrate/nitrite transporter NrtS [Myxococcales bacterium]|nr:nitrate/nitrite transporter NrtS [Myxococcales bacterium]
MALVVGPILIFINHGDSILQGEIGPVRALKMAFTMAVPYLVSTFSSVGALRRQG